MAQQKPIIAPEARLGNVKFSKIYNRAKDKDVAVVLLIVKETILCANGGYALTAKEVCDCCEQGCIVYAGGGFYRPVFWKENGGITTVVCLDNSGSSGALDAKVFTSYQAH